MDGPGGGPDRLSAAQLHGQPRCERGERPRVFSGGGGTAGSGGSGEGEEAQRRRRVVQIEETLGRAEEVRRDDHR